MSGLSHKKLMNNDSDKGIYICTIYMYKCHVFFFFTNNGQ